MEGSTAATSAGGHCRRLAMRRPDAGARPPCPSRDVRMRLGLQNACRCPQCTRTPPPRSPPPPRQCPSLPIGGIEGGTAATSVGGHCRHLCRGALPRVSMWPSGDGLMHLGLQNGYRCPQCSRPPLPKSPACQSRTHQASAGRTFCIFSKTWRRKPGRETCAPAKSPTPFFRKTCWMFLA